MNINPSGRTLAGCRRIARALVAVSPDVEVRILHWVDAAAARADGLRGVIVGPNGTPFPAYPPAFDRFLAWLRGRRGPTLGICGGHQALALAHGAPVGPVFPVPAATLSYDGMPKLSGRTRVRLVGDRGPLLAGLGDEIEVHASHVDEVKGVPPGFRLLGLGDPCHIQAIGADRRPSWGVQFHPERDVRPGQPGRRLLQNFLALAS